MVERLVLPEAVRQELIAHAREGEPDEVCGILGGRGETIERVFRIGNTADRIGAERGVFRDGQTGVAAGGRRAVHYYMDPKDQLRVYNEIDDLGLELVGYYHSHTRSQARPSPTDVRLAIDSNAYWVLVSLADAQHPIVRAWRIAKADPGDETGTVTEVPLSA